MQSSGRPQKPKVTSKFQIDRLGDRLKGDQATNEDLRLLDEFRRSFSSAYETVIAIITGQGLQPTGRPAKSTSSISEKLKRESIRLTQIQDIAGCRVVVSDSVEQEKVVSDLVRAFPKGKVIDRRTSPSYGYRAVHIVVDVNGRRIEIQVRTGLQHLWAELSEKASDIIDPAIKYGGGGGGAIEVRTTLSRYSRLIARVEKLQRMKTDNVSSAASIKELQMLEQELSDTLQDLIVKIERSHDLSN